MKCIPLNIIFKHSLVSLLLTLFLTFLSGSYIFAQGTVVGTYSSNTTPSGWSQNGIGFNQWGCGPNVYLIQAASHYVQSPSYTFKAGLTYTINISTSCQNSSPHVEINGTRVISNCATNANVSFTPASDLTGGLKIIPVNNGAIGITKVTITFPITSELSSNKSSITGFSICAGSGASTSQSYTLTGTSLTNNVTIVAPTNFEISKDNTSFSAGLTIIPSSGNVSQTIYVRLKSGLTAGNYGPVNITHSSSPATSISVSCSGTVLSQPSISTQPNTSNATYCFDATASSISVIASGAGISYQWYKNTISTSTGGTLLASETSNSITPSTNIAGDLYYYCVVSGTCAMPVASNTSGKITTSAIITTPGTITNNSPQCASAITFTKGSCGVGTCYWVSSTTGTETTNSSNTYTTPNTVGVYTVYVRAKSGSCWSSAVSSTGSVDAAASISSHPSTTNQTLCLNQSPATLSITASGGGLSYQWYKNATASNSGGTIISGATSASYSPPTNSTGTNYYYCIVASSCGAPVTSNVSGFVLVHDIPSVSVSSNSPVFSTESLQLTGLPNGLTAYNWSGPNSYSSTQQSPTITSPTNNNDGIYTLTVTDANGCQNSASTPIVEVNVVINYYSKSSGNITDLSTWGTNTNGSGTSPTSFTDSYQTFYLHNYTNPTLDKSWTIGGTQSKLIIGNGTAACNLTIPTNFSLTTTGEAVVDVKNNSTLTIRHTTIPALGTLSTGSTVVYNGTGAQTIQANNYYNLTVSGSRSSSTITFAPSYVTVAGTLTLSATNCSYVVTGNTIVFDGVGAQNIPAFTYNNLHTELGGTKTLAGNTTVLNKLRIGAITTLNASSYDLTLSGSDTIVTQIGTFQPATSTVKYTSSNSAIICAMNYYNLNATGGNRIFEGKNIVTIKNTFTKGAGTYTSTNSIVSFAGSSAQSIPSLNYYTLYINNASGLSLAGDITIAGSLSLFSGILNTNSYNITVTNTNPNAVTEGSSTTHINGKLTRYFAANLNKAVASYIFPIGKLSKYYPFTMNYVSTGTTAPVISVEAITSNSGGSAGTGLASISSSEYWDVNYTGSFNTCRVSIGRSSGITENAIGHSSSLAGAYETKQGTVSGYTIANSDETSFSYFVLATRSTGPIVYYSKSGANLDLSVLSNWGTNTDGTGTAPTSFSQNDVTYNIRNTTSPTINSNWTVTGANTNITLGNTATTTFTIPSNYTFSTTGNFRQSKNSTLLINSAANVVVDGNYSYTNFGNYEYQDLQNYGTLTINGSLTQTSGSFSRIYNNSTGIINLNGDYSKGQNTWFYNSGVFNITNGSLSIVSNYENVFENLNGGVLNIDNSSSPGNNVYFDNINFNTGFIIDAGSSVNLVKTDLDISNGNGTLTIAGELAIEDANFNYTSGGATLNIPSSGGLYMYDTDNNGDGLIDLSNGGLSLNVDGIAYVEGLTVNNGGGSHISVTNGGEMFVGNVGLYTGLNNNEITVQSGGTLNYCGNKTPYNENMGTIQSGGLLNYALGYYTTQTPGSQLDFTVNGTENGAYANSEVCRASFLSGTPAGAGIGFLPIELTLLYASCNGQNQIEINWQTSSETNNDYFTLLRSFDGKNFDLAGTINGAGNSSSTLNYSYSDKVKNYGIVYYKLVQTDFDGTMSFSKIIAVQTCGDISFYTFSKDKITVDFDNSEIQHQVIITSIDGKILFSKSYNNIDYVEIPTQYAKGLYIISTITSSQITSEKFFQK